MSHQTLVPVPKQAPPTAISRNAGVLRRQCACGQHTGGAGTCEGCRKDQTSLQRQRAGLAEPSTVPPIVADVLRAPGRPLEAGLRAFFEPRFGHDFSGVRVHTDSTASASARAVNALAYTVGRDVVFGAGQYAPATTVGRSLLAHELAHTVQQPGAIPDAPLSISDPAGLAERQAASVSAAILRGPVTFSPHVARGVARQARPVEDTGKPATAKNYAGESIEKDKVRMETVTGAKAGGGSPLVSKEGFKFVLHDTVGLLSDDSLESYRKTARIPSLETATGVAAYVPRTGVPSRNRPRFFEPNRPSVTLSEQRVHEIARTDKEKAFQLAWKSTSKSSQTDALDEAFSGLTMAEGTSEEDLIASGKMTPSEITKEKVKVRAEFGAKLSETDKTLHTESAWVVTALCKKAPVGADPKNLVEGNVCDDEDNAKGLLRACDQLRQYLDLGAERIAARTNVEIIQVKGNRDLAPIDPATKEHKPAYTETQYANVADLYLQAALEASQFPEITTHYLVDTGIAGSHYDPRCFNLDHLYELIGVSLNHPVGSHYGVAPTYGVNPYPRDDSRPLVSVWWREDLCGKKPSKA